MQCVMRSFNAHPRPQPVSRIFVPSSDLAATTLLYAENEHLEKVAQYDTLQDKYETIQRRLQGITYKVVMVVHDGAIPTIEVAYIERIEAA
jgi:hypothetical protein